MSLSRTGSEIDGDFISRKSQIFPTPVYFMPADGFPLGIEHRRNGSKNYDDGAIRWSKNF